MPEDLKVTRLMITRGIKLRLRILPFIGSAQLKDFWYTSSSLEVIGYKSAWTISSTWFEVKCTSEQRLHLTFQAITSLIPLRQAIMGDCGLSSHELPTKVWIPETNGYLITRTITFNRLSFSLVNGRFIRETTLVANRINVITDVVAQWVGSQRTICHVNFVLANYPPSDGKIGCAVGLDSLASIRNLGSYCNENSLTKEGELIKLIKSGITNSGPLNKIIRGTISLSFGAAITRD